MKNLRIVSAFLFSCLGFALYAQEPQQQLSVIKLTNPSFEDTPRKGEKGGSGPNGWLDCGGPDETSPDVQPGCFGVVKPASNGATYMSLVVRENETYESVAQRLSQPLEAGNCYEWSLDLARDDEYSSPTRQSKGKKVSFSSPVEVRIWGGNDLCERAELLHTTPEVFNNRWLGYMISLNPQKGSYSFIVIEAYFKKGTLSPYNGNVLVDNASAIKQIGCSKPEEEPKPVVTTIYQPSPLDKLERNGRKLSEIDSSQIIKGRVSPIKDLYFDDNQFAIKQECAHALDDLYLFLSKNPTVVIEIGGHTDNRPSDTIANELSTNRAKAVADWLTNKGIPSNRVQYKGYGKTMPIAPNTTEEGKKKNQRVEIKILSVTG